MQTFQPDSFRSALLKGILDVNRFILLSMVFTLHEDGPGESKACRLHFLAVMHILQVIMKFDGDKCKEVLYIPKLQRSPVSVPNMDCSSICSSCSK